MHDVTDLATGDERAVISFAERCHDIGRFGGFVAAEYLQRPVRSGVTDPPSPIPA